jgi:DNA-binding CsgD family transcriptional regulator
MSAEDTLTPAMMVTIARKAANRWRRYLPVDDAEAAAYEGVLFALETFNPARGTPRAAWCAMQARWAVLKAEQAEAPHAAAVSVETPISDGCTLGDTLAAPDVNAQQDTCTDLLRLMRRAELRPMESRVLVATTLAGRTMYDVAAAMGLTVNQARYLRDCAMAKLRATARSLSAA